MSQYSSAPKDALPQADANVSESCQMRENQIRSPKIGTPQEINIYKNNLGNNDLS